MNTQTALSSLAPGQSGVILRVDHESGPVKRRLADMGLTPGVLVTVCRTAPFGDPIVVRLRGYELSLRRADAERIAVCPPDKAPPPGPIRSGKHGAVRPVPDKTVLHRALGREGKLALAGNPNCGKTTLFNALTGSNQYVGNWPGVTVEKKEGRAETDGHSVTIVDLPGIYSLSPYSAEEVVARDFILNGRPDGIINIVDGANLERNLYLTVQLLELERPMVVALNFMDEVDKRGDRIDIARLSQALGVPVLPITARTGEHIEELLRTAYRQMYDGVTPGRPDSLYDGFTREILCGVSALIGGRADRAGLPAHWAAVKLLEGDTLVDKSLELDAAARRQLEQTAEEFESAYPLGDRETLIADARYRCICETVQTCVKRGQPPGASTRSDRIDAVVTHKYIAIPAFLLMMLLMFTATFGPPGTFLSQGMDQLINGCLAAAAERFLTACAVEAWLRRLVCEGILGGVGGVLTFLPQIALLFLFLSLLEDSGCMARAALIMDRLLGCFGLSGKAFIPMLMGFGCTVPAVMGARTMEHEKDRRMTILLTPFMSCSARLPVYGLISAAFFPHHAWLVVFSLYLLGSLCAILSGFLFRHTLFRGECAPFVLELPPYRLPTLKNCVLHVWEKVHGFLVKAGTLILVMSVALWFLQSFDLSLRMVEDAADSILGQLGASLAPALAPLGFGTWQAAVALLTGLVAKEAVVSSLSLFCGFSTLDSGGVIRGALSCVFPTPAAAYAFLVFVLLYVPCAAAVSTIYREMDSLKWTVFCAAWQLLCAYGISFLVFRIGCLFF